MKLILVLLVTISAYATDYFHRYEGQRFSGENAKENCEAKLSELIESIPAGKITVVESTCEKGYDDSYLPVVSYSVRSFSDEIRIFEYKYSSLAECIDNKNEVMTNFEAIEGFQVIDSFCAASVPLTSRPHLRISYQSVNVRSFDSYSSLWTYSSKEQCLNAKDDLFRVISFASMAPLTYECSPSFTGEEFTPFVTFVKNVGDKIVTIRGAYEEESCTDANINIFNGIHLIENECQFIQTRTETKRRKAISIKIDAGLKGIMKNYKGINYEQKEACLASLTQFETNFSNNRRQLVYGFCKRSNRGFSPTLHYFEFWRFN